MNDTGLLLLLVLGFALIAAGAFVVNVAAGLIITGSILVGAVIAYARPRT